MFKLVEIPNDTEYRCETDDGKDFWIEKKDNGELMIGAYPQEIEKIIEYFYKKLLYNIEDLIINKEVWGDYGEVLIQFKVEEQIDLKEQLEKVIYEYKSNIEKEMMKKQEKRERALFELVYNAKKGCSKYYKLDEEGDCYAEMESFLVHRIIEPSLKYINKGRIGQIERISLSKEGISEWEALERYLTKLQPLNFDDAKWSQDILQGELQKYELSDIAKVIEDGYVIHNAKIINFEEMIDFLVESKNNNFGINIFTNFENNEYIVFHTAEIGCYDVYNTDQIINSWIIDKDNLGKAILPLYGDHREYLLNDLSEIRD